MSERALTRHAPEGEPPAAAPSWTRAQVIAFSSTFVAYAACYLARNNAAVVKTVLDWTPQALGALDASFLVAYTLGSFAFGALTDTLGAWPALAGGLLGSGLCQGGLALLGTSAGPVPMGTLYFCNGLFQSILYPACKKIMGDSFDEGQGRGAALGWWCTCYYAGSILSTTVASHLLSSTPAGGSSDGWRVVFAVPALALTAIAGLTVPVRAALDAELRAAGTPPTDAAPPAPSASAQAAEAAASLQSGGAGAAFFAAALDYPTSIWLTAASYALVKCTRYAFLLWLPLFLVQDLRLSFQQAAFTAALFDVGSVGGSLCAGVLSDRVGSHSGLATSMLVPLAAILCALPAVADMASPAALPAAIFALGLCVGGAETLQGAVAPLRYSAPARRATSVGFVNGWGSFGTVVAAPAIPAVAAAAGGIEHAFALLGPLALMAGTLTFLQWAVYDAKEAYE